MQQKSEFAQRTDALAEHLGIRVIDLPSRLKMSEDMLMGYRTGRYEISKKAWGKLEVAEVEAGVGAVVKVEEEQAAYGDAAKETELVMLDPPLDLEAFVREHPTEATMFMRHLLATQRETGKFLARVRGYERKKSIL